MDSEKVPNVTLATGQRLLTRVIAVLGIGKYCTVSSMLVILVGFDDWPIEANDAEGQWHMLKGKLTYINFFGRPAMKMS